MLKMDQNNKSKKSIRSSILEQVISKQVKITTFNSQWVLNLCDTTSLRQRCLFNCAKAASTMWKSTMARGRAKWAVSRMKTNTYTIWANHEEKSRLITNKNKPGQSSSYLPRRLKIPKNEVRGSKALGTVKIQNGKISEGCTNGCYENVRPTTPSLHWHLGLRS